MKNTLIALLLLVSVQSFGQIDISDMTKNERNKDKFVGPPRQRVSTATALVLTDQWQTIAFVSGASSFNSNTFPESRWDFTNNKLIMNPNTMMEQAYDLSFDYTVTNVKGSSKIQLRFVIPAPSPIYFPFPDDGSSAYVDLSEINMPGAFKRHFQYSIYGNNNMRQYGVQIQIRAISYITNAVGLGAVVQTLLTTLTNNDRVTLNNCNLNIYAK